jgi:ABC-type polysaccharide/polyol phosphate export permease
MLVDVLQYANPVTPILTAIRDPLFFGQYPSWVDVVYSVVAATISLAVGALVFRRIDDRLAVEL